MPTISENTPLLSPSAGGPVSPTDQVKNPDNDQDAQYEVYQARQAREKSQLPKLQIFVLCCARVVEPIAFFGIFPFISEMLLKTGNLEEADVGFHAGLIESLFSVTQMTIMIQWGRAADRVGRKPVLVFSLMGVAFATTMFGLSTSIWQMVVFRCCAGLFSGTVVTVRTMISENSTPETKARAFSFFAFSTNVGMFLGPMIGGALANPAREIGGIFQRIEFFSKYPYSLPTLVFGLIGASAAVLSATFLKETLKRSREGDQSQARAPTSILEILRAPGVAIILFFYAHVMLIGIGYTAVTNVFWFTNPALGGYGLSDRQISYFVGGGGLAQAVWILLVFPSLQRRYGTCGVLRGCLFTWPVFFAATPMANYFLRQGWTVSFWILAILFQIVASGVAMAFTTVQLALNDISPSPATLGTLNGIALTMTASIRTVAPAAFTSLFAIGVKTQVFSGYLVWVVLVTLAALSPIAGGHLLARAEKIMQASDDDEVDEQVL